MEEEFKNMRTEIIGKFDTLNESIGQVNITLARQDERLKNIEKRKEDGDELEKRVRSVEQKQYYLAGSAAVTGAIIGNLFKKLTGG